MTLGTQAFSDCPRLITYSISPSNPHFQSLDGILFTNSLETLILYPPAKLETTYRVPETVRSIGPFAFAKCDNLIGISLPEDLLSIEPSAFASCFALEQLSLPQSITSIEDSTFDLCTSLSQINLPDTLTSIGNSAFANCDSLTSISLPSNSYLNWKLNVQIL